MRGTEDEDADGHANGHIDGYANEYANGHANESGSAHVRVHSLGPSLEKLLSFLMSHVPGGSPSSPDNTTTNSMTISSTSTWNIGIKLHFSSSSPDITMQYAPPTCTRDSPRGWVRLHKRRIHRGRVLCSRSRMDSSGRCHVDHPVV
jgi:hypothetical protein